MADQNDGGDAAPELPKIVWKDDNTRTTYANVVNCISSREEVMIFFGTNQSWNLQAGDELTVDLTDRMIMNPHAAKRLLTLLAAVLAQYEKRHGKININPRDFGAAESGATPPKATE